MTARTPQASAGLSLTYVNSPGGRGPYRGSMDDDEIARLREEIDRYESHYRSIADAEVRKTLSALIAEKRKRLSELEGKPPAT